MLFESDHITIQNALRLTVSVSVIRAFWKAYLSELRPKYYKNSK